MAAPRFRLACDFYAVPSTAELVDGATVDSGNYAYSPDKTLGHFFPAGTSATHSFTFLGEPPVPTGFTATWRLNDMGTWSMTMTAAENDVDMAALIGALRPSQDDRPRAFAVWQIIAEDENGSDGIDEDLSDPFCASFILDDPDSDYPMILTDRLPNAPAWSKRGMSGPVRKIDWRRSAPGQIEFTIKGSDWLWAAQSTTQRRDVPRPALPAPNDNPPNQIAFRTLCSELLKVNAVYTTKVLVETELADGSLEGQQDFQISLADNALPGGLDVALSDKIITPVGLYGIICGFTRPAITKMTNDGSLISVFSTPPGAHNMLQTFQRLVERVGLIFYAVGPVIVFDAPGDEAAPSAVWTDGQECISTHLTDEIPEATSIWTKQSDYRRDWHVSTSIPATVQAHGHIQSSNVSVARKPASIQDEIAYAEGLTQRQVLQASDTMTLESIRAQNKALALELSDNLSGTCQPLWTDDTRFGVDFRLGDAIELRLTEFEELWSQRAGLTSETSRRGLINRQFQLTFNAVGWGCTTSFGALADVAPEMLPYEAAVPPRLPRTPPVSAPIVPSIQTPQAAPPATSGTGQTPQPPPDRTPEPPGPPPRPKPKPIRPVAKPTKPVTKAPTTTSKKPPTKSPSHPAVRKLVKEVQQRRKQKGTFDAHARNAPTRRPIQRSVNRKPLNPRNQRTQTNRFNQYTSNHRAVQTQRRRRQMTDRINAARRRGLR